MISGGVRIRYLPPEDENILKRKCTHATAPGVGEVLPSWVGQARNEVSREAAYVSGEKMGPVLRVGQLAA